MRLLAFLATVAVAAIPASAQVGRLPAGTTVLAGPGATTKPGLGWHLNVRHRVLAVPLDSLPGFLSGLSGSLTLSADGYYQRGLVNDGSPWLLGSGLASRWDPAPEGWAVRPYFIPLSVGVFVEGLAFSDGLRPALGIGNGIGVEVPIGAAALTVEGRAVRLYTSDGEKAGTAPFSVGVRF